jgi:hypothetical protein
VTGSTHALMTDSDPLHETELRASGVPFLLALAFRVFWRISLMRWVMLLSASGYTSRNRLISLPKLGEGIRWHARMDKECVNLLFVLLKYYLSLTAQASCCSPHQTGIPFCWPIPQSKPCLWIYLRPLLRGSTPCPRCAS